MAFFNLYICLMQKYINSIVESILNTHKEFNNITIVLPSKRAGVFIKNELKNKLATFQFLPQLISIEELVVDISKIDSADNLVLLFEFYKIYIENTETEKIESFDEFSNWATTLITDFNEIDSYLINQNAVFNYLKDINRIDNWFNIDESKTELTKKYIHFFEKIEIYYNCFYKHLVSLKIGYQGLQYREANSNLDKYILNNHKNKYIFIGFNALNKVEENIIQSFLHHNIAEIYFDIDEFLLKENISAASFIKKYKKNWKYFDKNPFKSTSNNLSAKKKISIIGTPKNVSQIKYANEIIQNNSEKQDNTALVLANEDLLLSTINSLPVTVKNINITMGLPLKNIQLSGLFYLLFNMHQNKGKIENKKDFYHKDIIPILNHPVLNFFSLNTIAYQIKTHNFIFIDKEQLLAFNAQDDTKELITLLFSDWSNCTVAIENCLKIMAVLKTVTLNAIEIEYLNRFEQIFNQTQTLNSKYGYIKTLKALINIYNQILNNESLSFKGQALKGLQIMGMLETRVLEFENIIITSVNEGFLPAGKLNNSFIPFDIKSELGLPTYQEKDAIFSYHFFRLIARATNIYLLYNTEPDEFGSGEQSRFITQLEYFKDKLPNLKITKTILSSKIDNESLALKIIKKDVTVMNQLKVEANKGFAPTTLTNYIYNPISFYKKKILKLKELDQIEETIAANTLGTVVHDVLENFYKPFVGKFVVVDDVINMKKNVNDSVTKVFHKEYKNGDITKGKNLLIFEVSKQYVINFLNQEIALLRDNNQLKILSLEQELSAIINIENVDFDIKLRGKADRIDQLNGVIRIIDYKTGKVAQKDLNIVTTRGNYWDKLIADHKFSKAFQVLMYAYMYAKMNAINFDTTLVESGIISFKNLKFGFMKVNKKNILQQDIATFEIYLKELLTTIFDEEIPFIENENLPY